MDEYSRWDDYDMSMSEEVIQNLLKVQNSLDRYVARPDYNRLNDLENILQTAINGIHTWAELVQENPQLNDEAETCKAFITGLNEEARSLASSFKSMSITRQGWDSLAEHVISRLEKTMKGIIDPAKKTAIDSNDIQVIIQWNNIDVIMNEAVMANA